MKTADMLALLGRAPSPSHTAHDQFLAQVREHGPNLDPSTITDPLERAAFQMAVAIRNAFKASAREDRSARIRQALAVRRATGQRHTRCPPYGWRWGSRDGRQVLKIDHEEQALAVRILNERDLGRSWHTIAVGLLRDGVRTRSCQDWSVARVRRVYAVADRARRAAASSSVA